MSRTTMRRFVHDRKGQTVIFVAIGMIMFLGIAALAVDIGWLYMVRNQLQNGADSGALAGAQVLYNNEGTSVNTGADAMAADYVQRNYSEQATVSVDSVTRGHWRFSDHTFHARPDVLTPPVLWDVTAEQLDANLDFVNAVQVVTRRKRMSGQLPEGIFARIWNQRTEVKATAVGYIGFAGKLEPFAVDQPIALCEDKITVDGEYSCGVGRMLNNSEQTARWTNFDQSGGCTANDGSVKDLICNTGNPHFLIFGEDMATTNGTQGNNVTKFEQCWRTNAPDADADTNPDGPWLITLPVVEGPCGGGDNCRRLVGAATVNVIWVNDKNDPHFAKVPRKMSIPVTGPTWVCPTAWSGQQCWTDFASVFHLQNASNQPLTLDDYQTKAVYFLPDCTPHVPTGITGGENFGILAKVPVLVK